MLGQNLVPYFFAGGSIVRAHSVNELVTNDAKGVEVDRVGMIHTTHDLRSHVSRSSRGVCCVIRGDVAGDTQVSYADISIRVEDKIFGFDVPVDDVVGVEVIKANKDAGDEKL